MKFPNGARIVDWNACPLHRSLTLILSTFMFTSLAVSAIPNGAKVYADPNQGTRVRSSPGNATVYYTVNAFTVGTVKSDVTSGVPIAGQGATKYDWYLIDWDWSSDVRDGYSATSAFVYRAPKDPTPASPGTEGSDDHNQPELIHSKTVTFRWEPVNVFEGSLTTHYLLTVNDLDARTLDTFLTSQNSHILNLTKGHRYKWNVRAVNGGVDGLQSGIAIDFFFNIVSSQYTITPSAGRGGSISPNTQQQIDATSQISFKAIPDDNMMVDQWYLDGATVLNGESKYTLPPVNANHTLLVTFKLKAYTLTVLTEHGTVGIEPPLLEFPHGGEILLTAKPNPDYSLYDWRGDISGVGNTLRFRITRNTTIRAVFQRFSPPISIAVANSTPSTNLKISIPANPEFAHVIQSSDDFMFSWRNLSVLMGNSSSSVEMNPITNKTSEIFRTSTIPITSGPRFLLFPVTNSINGSKYTSTSTPVSAVFDHHGSHVVPVAYSNERDGAIETYNGILLTILNSETTAYSTAANQRVKVNNLADSPYNYKNRLPNGERAFTLIAIKVLPAAVSTFAFNYQNNDGYLYYDGHSGYDYVVGGVLGDRVRAAADGWLVPQDFDCYNTISIDHGNGYKTCYLHMREDQIDDGIKTNGEIREKFIIAGQILGSPGDVGGCRGKKVGIHLHFEVRHKTKDAGGNEKWVWVDPYGHYASDHRQIDPPLWLPNE